MNEHIAKSFKVATFWVTL